MERKLKNHQRSRRRANIAFQSQLEAERTKANPGITAPPAEPASDHSASPKRKHGAGKPAIDGPGQAGRGGERSRKTDRRLAAPCGRGAPLSGCLGAPTTALQPAAPGGSLRECAGPGPPRPNGGGKWAAGPHQPRRGPQHQVIGQANQRAAIRPHCGSTASSRAASRLPGSRPSDHRFR